MKVYRWLSLPGAGLITACAVLSFVAASSTAHAASPDAPCDVRLSVELTPDVPNPEDEGFLSSLLSNHVGYRLTLQPEHDPSMIVVDLTGPGPDYRCEEVIEAMRRDGRVLSIRTDDDDTLAVSVVAAHVPPEQLEELEEPVAPEAPSDLHVSNAGIGSLYWAARNPSQAWQAVSPVHPDDASGAYADFKARCEFLESHEFLSNRLIGQAGCP